MPLADCQGLHFLREHRGFAEGNRGTKRQRIKLWPIAVEINEHALHRSEHLLFVDREMVTKEKRMRYPEHKILLGIDIASKANICFCLEVFDGSCYVTHQLSR